MEAWVFVICLFGFFVVVAVVIFAILGIKPKVWHMLGKNSTTELHPQPQF
jgi:hypothetical protein